MLAPTAATFGGTHNTFGAAHSVVHAFENEQGRRACQASLCCPVLFRIHDEKILQVVPQIAKVGHPVADIPSRHCRVHWSSANKLVPEWAVRAADRVCNTDLVTVWGILNPKNVLGDDGQPCPMGKWAGHSVLRTLPPPPGCVLNTQPVHQRGRCLLSRSTGEVSAEQINRGVVC